MKLCLVCGAKFASPLYQCPSCRSEPETIGGYPAFSPEMSETSAGFEAGFFEQLYALEANNFWFRSRNRLIIWALRRYFPGARNFFEIGCGTGFVLSGIEKEFPRIELYGSEIYTAGLAFAARRVKNASLFQMDALKIPFEDEFDCIGAFDVLEHIKEDEAVLSAVYRAVSHGGGVILTVPQHMSLWSHVDDRSCHARRYSSAELRSKVEAAGFRVERMTSFVSFLLPLMMLSRMRKSEDMTRELRVGGITNALLEKILGLERGLIKLGVNLPAGGSLLLIAKKI
ncbi:MAG: class I SAM-dependent methyltransferase [Deltaproteobacteria bacterium]|nr:class I SAM-dependent methyltransferase [Deltaproteobacteria bacterium]